MDKSWEKNIINSKITAIPGSEEAIETEDFGRYQIAIIHDWLKTLTILAVVLVPLFFVLDIFMMPAVLLPRFAIYRFSSTFISIVVFILVRKLKPSRWSFLFGYLISLQIGGMIALMTTDLGGFNSSYYAGLNLVTIGVNLLMPWRARHTAINTFIILFMYVFFNLFIRQPIDSALLTNNMFFFLSTCVIAVSINFVRFKLIENEFSLLVELKKARDALWSEMELAKRIQTALLPRLHGIKGYDIAVTMLPAKEVGGDYYDIIETETGNRWVTIGDVSGHGVDSGLIMMMAQTSIMTVITGNPSVKPMDILNTTNRVIREDINKLGSSHYMTLMVMEMEDDTVTLVGHHQDVLRYKKSEKKTETIAVKGTWIGIADQIESYFEIKTINIGEGDILLLFTDGVTEAANSSGEMFGQGRLIESLERYAELPVEKALDNILTEIKNFQAEQNDDITLILLKKKSKDSRC